MTNSTMCNAGLSLWHGLFLINPCPNKVSMKKKKKEKLKRVEGWPRINRRAGGLCAPLGKLHLVCAGLQIVCALVSLFLRTLARLAAV